MDGSHDLYEIISNDDELAVRLARNSTSFDKAVVAKFINLPADLWGVTGLIYQQPGGARMVSSELPKWWQFLLKKLVKARFDKICQVLNNG